MFYMFYLFYMDKPPINSKTPNLPIAKAIILRVR